MKCLFWAALILLLDVSISQEMQVPCQNLEDCLSLKDVPRNITCNDGYCKCRDVNGTLESCGSISTTSSMDPQRQVTGVVGRVCSMDKDCTAITAESFCNTTRKQCQCKVGFFGSVNNLSCISGIRYNESGCKIDQQCLYYNKNTTCTNEVCVCALNHLYDNNTCFEQKGFGTSCSVTSECLQIEHAVCSEERLLCICPVTRVINPNGTACLPIASNIGDECVESIQCTQLLGDQGICMDQQCSCKENHHHSSVSFKCVLNRELGAECQMDYECSNGDDSTGHGHMRCSSSTKRCECAEGFENIDGKCQSTGGNGSAAARLGEVATLVLGLAYFVLLSAML